MKADAVRIVASQFPRQVLEHIKVDLDADPMLLRATVKVEVPDKRVFTAQCEPYEFEGMTLNLKVPEEFLAKICVVV